MRLTQQQTTNITTTNNKLQQIPINISFNILYITILIVVVIVVVGVHHQLMSQCERQRENNASLQPIDNYYRHIHPVDFLRFIGLAFKQRRRRAAAFFEIIPKISFFSVTF